MITRRTLTAAAVALALSSQGGWALAAEGAETIRLNTDVIVVGAGGTGMAAAASAVEHGAKVIVLEKLGLIGGSSALAGGAIAAGDSNAQKRAGETETTTDGFAKIWLDDQTRSYKGGSPNYPDEALVRKMTAEFTTTVNWLEDVVGHTFAKPRPFGYGGPDYAHAPAESPIPASGRGSSAAGGRFVIKNLKLYLDKMGAEVRTGTPVESLILAKDGTVEGVIAHDRKARYEIRGKAVVLATGGFAHNKEMMEELVPAYAPYTDISVASPGATGDGIRMAMAAGAERYSDAWVIGLFVNGTKPGLAASFTSKDKYKDRVFVNESGNRFMNEDLPYLTDPIAMQKAVWAIVDSADPAKTEKLKGLNDPKVAVSGGTWEELAKAMGVSPENLAATMKTYNDACATGEDKAFGKPKAFLKPFGKAPFYAVRVVPQTGGTMGGVKVNDRFQVLRADGSVIKGLYAGGEVMNRPYYNRVYTSGTGLGIAYTSGRIAGMYAAAEK